MKISRRKFVRMAGVTLAGVGLTGFSALVSGCGDKQAATVTSNSASAKSVVESDGTSQVYFTKNIDADHLIKLYEKVNGEITGKVAVKLHTGEPHGPNIIPRPWVKELMASRLPNAAIVETNTYYDGGRFNTADHRKAIEINGWTFCPVDITDENGTTLLPVPGGKWFKEMSMGKNIVNYDSFLALTHFKGHAMGGFGGSDKNIGIGCADGRIGKKWIHTEEGKDQWSITQEEFMERMTESTKAITTHFAHKIVFIM